MGGINCKCEDVVNNERVVGDDTDRYYSIEELNKKL